ncbi:hypothetical protein ACJW30_12G101200 [Castanea mollissima]
MVIGTLIWNKALLQSTASAKAPPVDAASYAIQFLSLSTTTNLIKEQNTKRDFSRFGFKLRMEKGGLELLCGFSEMRIEVDYVERIDGFGVVGFWGLKEIRVIQICGLKGFAGSRSVGTP